MTNQKDNDGIQTHYAKDGAKHTHYNIDVVLKQTNPRQLFTVGQLYVEMVCDDIISIYFVSDDIIRQGVFRSFLTSGDLNFSTKTRLLRTLIYLDNKSQEIVNRVVSKELIISLQAIAEVRNAFQHNLEFDAALAQVKRGTKFPFVQKRLSEYKDINSLMADFKTEVNKVYSELNVIAMNVSKMPRYKATEIEPGQIHLEPKD